MGLCLRTLRLRTMQTTPTVALSWSFLSRLVSRAKPPASGCHGAHPIKLQSGWVNSSVKGLKRSQTGSGKWIHMCIDKRWMLALILCLCLHCGQISHTQCVHNLCIVCAVLQSFLDKRYHAAWWFAPMWYKPIPYIWQCAWKGFLAMLLDTGRELRPRMYEHEQGKAFPWFLLLLSMNKCYIWGHCVRLNHLYKRNKQLMRDDPTNILAFAPCKAVTGMCNIQIISRSGAEVPHKVSGSKIHPYGIHNTFCAWANAVLCHRTFDLHDTMIGETWSR